MKSFELPISLGGATYCSLHVLHGELVVCVVHWMVDDGDAVRGRVSSRRRQVGPQYRIVQHVHIGRDGMVALVVKPGLQKNKQERRQWRQV